MSVKNIIGILIKIRIGNKIDLVYEFTRKKTRT